VSGGASPPRALLLDIEGTTTPISFVYEVLFPYAREHAASFLREHADRPSMRPLIAQLRKELGSDGARSSMDEPLTEPHTPRVDALAADVVAAIDRDRKTTGLKTLQGLIWQEGYRSGGLRGEVFEDVPPALARWHRAGIDVRIYSSGSVLAQRLLFETVRTGDLTRYLRGYFDTETGAKTDPGSYGRIAAAFDLRPADVLFISDVVTELEAAREAGLRICLAVRPGNPAQPSSGSLQSIRDFDALGF
jgi:enolase-phosphatase E1